MCRGTFAEAPLNALLTRDCSETEDEINSKIAVAANRTMLETDTCGGLLDVLTFLQEDAHPSRRTISPIEIQQGDSGSFGRFFSSGFLFSDTSDTLSEAAKRREIGIRCINYFFSGGFYFFSTRFRRILAEGATEDLLNKTTYGDEIVLTAELFQQKISFIQIN